MPDRLLLIDNDAFVLLAGSGHLERLLAIIGMTIKDCRRLPSLGPIFQRRIANVMSEAHVNRINAMISEIKPLEHIPSSAVHAKLTSVRGIDAGEAVLYGVLAEHDAMLLTTNDKRSMRTLCGDISLKDIRGRVAGRVICIEATARKLVENDGVSVVGPPFAEVAARDVFLRVAFTELTMVNDETCLNAIDSYLIDLRERVGSGFLYEF